MMKEVELLKISATYTLFGDGGYLDTEAAVSIEGKESHSEVICGLGELTRLTFRHMKKRGYKGSFGDFILSTIRAATESWAEEL